MRATIKTEEYQYVAGIFKREPRWKVVCKLEFSSEELAIIRNRNLSDLHIYTQNLGNSDDIQVYLKEVIKHGIWSVFLTPVDAKQFEQELTNELLPTLRIISQRALT